MRKRATIVLLIVAIFAVVGMLGVQYLTLSALVVADEQTKQEQDETQANDGRGFIAVCDAFACVTVPVLIERSGKEWQLGYYPEEYGAEEARLSYRNEQGTFMSVEEAFW